MEDRKTEETREGLAVLERQFVREPENMEVRWEIVRLAIALGESKLALTHLQALYRVDPLNTEVLELLARLFGELKQGQKVLSVYRELAKIYAQRGEVEKRREALRRILQLDPDDAEARAAVGQ